MTDIIDPERLQIIELRQRALSERLKSVGQRQAVLLNEEGQIRGEMQRLENEKYALLVAC